MPVIGSSFKELHFKRFEVVEKDVKLGRVKSDVKIKDISEREVNIPNVKKALVFEFEFLVDYQLEKPADKNFGEIRIVGELVYVDSEESQKKILNSWKKKKKIDAELIRNIVGSALEMSQLEAIYLARKVMLPPPIPLPRLKFSEDKQEYIG